jgi:(p)ppGpp synthase/HD superfamily hydrolase
MTSPTGTAQADVMLTELTTMRSMNLILQAARCAELAHRGQKRKLTGRPAIEHPARVASRLSYHPAADDCLIAAAWLHDVLEDTEFSAEELGVFLPGLALTYVKALTNPSKHFSTITRAKKKEMDRDHLRQCTGAVRLIKLVDRADNMRDMCYPNADLGWARTYIAESEALLKCIFIPHDPATVELKQAIEDAKVYFDARADHLDRSA